MGRTEKRKQIRLDAKYEKSQTITMNRFDLYKMKQDLATEITGYFTVGWHNSYALAMARRGHLDDVYDIIQEADKIQMQLMNDEISLENISDELEEKYGIVIKTK